MRSALSSLALVASALAARDDGTPDVPVVDIPARDVAVDLSTNDVTADRDDVTEGDAPARDVATDRAHVVATCAVACAPASKAAVKTRGAASA